MEVHTKAKECNQSSPTIGNNNACKVENYRQNLAYGHSKRKGTEDIEESIYVSEGSDQDMCPALKEGWFNYGKASAVPSNLWKKCIDLTLFSKCLVVPFLRSLRSNDA